jgi:hypothetical protein
MGLLSILLSALAVVCAGVGVLTTPIPKLGLIFAFGAPALAVVGIMLGGSAMSRAKRGGETSETGRIGAILSAIAFVPSILVALTCGVCNAFFSSGNLQVHKDFRVGNSPFADAGAGALPPPQRLAVGGSDQTEPPPPPSSSDGKAPPPPPTAAPSGTTTLPPPPLPPGPGK